MKANMYSGDVAYYATMQALLEAMRATVLMTKNPDKVILKTLDIVEEIAISKAPIALKMRCADPTFRAVMQKHVAECGLCEYSVLSLLRKFENE